MYLQAGEPVEVVESRIEAARRSEMELETMRRRRGLLDDVPHSVKKARMGRPPPDGLADGGAASSSPAGAHVFQSWG